MTPGELFFIAWSLVVHLKSLLIRCTFQTPFQAKDKMRRVGPKISINHRGLRIATKTPEFGVIRNLFGCRIAPFHLRTQGFEVGDRMETKQLKTLWHKEIAQ